MSLEKPGISVIMSTYNRKEFLPRAVDSILSQTYRDFELILVNNGCNDGSEILCREYFQRDGRIRLINIQENKGAAYARNQGMEEAVGEYITFVDDDDYCEPEMLDFLWDLAKQYNADISICGSWYDFQGVKKLKFVFDELVVLDKVGGLDELLKREIFNVSPPTKLFRKSLFENIKFKENTLVDDIHIIYKVFANADRVAAKGKPLYSFRKHGSNMTGFIQANKLTPAILNEYLNAFKERSEYLGRKVPAIAEKARYSEWSYMISMCDKIEKYKCYNCKEQYNAMIKELAANYSHIINSPFTTQNEKEKLDMYISRDSI